MVMRAFCNMMTLETMVCMSLNRDGIGNDNMCVNRKFGLEVDP